MEQYTTATTTTGEQIVVQTANGQIQQQVSSELTEIKLGYDKDNLTDHHQLTPSPVRSQGADARIKALQWIPDPVLFSW